MPNSLSAFPKDEIFNTEMGTDGVVDEISVASDTGVSIQPPAGETWIISTATTYGDGTNAGYMSMYDGSLFAEYLLNPKYGIGQGNLYYSCFRDGKIFIDNTIYLYFFNHAAASKLIAYSGMKWPEITDREIKADIWAVIAGGRISIIPPTGEVWLITTATGRPSAASNIAVGMNHSGVGVYGSLVKPNSGIGEGNDDYGCFRDGNLLTSSDLRLVLTNFQATTQSVSYSGVRWK